MDKFCNSTIPAFSLSEWIESTRMARSYPADIQVQAAMLERYRKENEAQLTHYLRARQAKAASKSNSDNANPEEDNGSQQKSRQIETLRRRLKMVPPPTHGEEGEANALPVHLSQSVGRHHKKKWNETMVEDRTLQEINRQISSLKFEMRPPSQSSKEILYDGFSQEGKGRTKYLTQRYLLDPEVKFTFPILSSMDYGWNITKIIPKWELKKSPFGRTRLIRDTFYTRTGIPMKSGIDQLTIRAKSAF